MPNFNSYIIIDKRVTLLEPVFLSESEFNKALTEINVKISDIDLILSTHWHVDHSSRAWYIKEKSNAEFLIHRDEKPLVESLEKRIENLGNFRDDEEFFTSWKTIMKYWDYRECEVSSVFKEGDIIDIGESCLKVIHTPGHTDGHCSFELLNNGEKILFAGDMSPKEYPWYGYIAGSVDDYIKSLERLKNEDWDVILSGHYKIYKKSGIDILKLYEKKIEFLKSRDEVIIGHIKNGCSTIDELIRHNVTSILNKESSWYNFTEYCHIIKHLKRLEGLNRIKQVKEDGIVKWISL